MSDAWKNPFLVAKSVEDNLQSCGEELSDGEDSCADQVVYQENHLENLLGLYNRSDEVKAGGRSEHDPLKIEGEVFEDHLALAVPSDRETAVWGALQASEFHFEESLGGQTNEADHIKGLTSWDVAFEGQPLLQEYLGSISTHKLENKNIEADTSEQTEASYVEARADIVSAEAQSRDDWDHVDANIDDINEYAECQSPLKFRSHRFQGRTKKKLNLSFRSMQHASHPKRDHKLKHECERLSMAQKFENLANPFSSRKNVQANPECLGSCSRVPINLKLLHLVQTEAKKAPGLPGKAKSGISVKAAFSTTRMAGESLNDQFCKALMEAPPVSSETLNKQGKILGTVSGFAARLQKVLEQERNDRTEFLRLLQTSHDLIEGKMSYMDVKVVSKSLEARLLACECNIVNSLEACDADAFGYSKIMVIFSMQANSQMELECGTVVRLYPPWKEILVQNANDIVKTILCTYFCEVLRNHETRQVE